MVLPLPNEELHVILEKKINNDKLEEEMDEDHANMIRSDIATLITEAMNDNIADKVVIALHLRASVLPSLNTNVAPKNLLLILLNYLLVINRRR